MKSRIATQSVSPLRVLEGKTYWKGWDQNLRARSSARGNGRVALRGVEIDYSRYTPDDYLLSWFTAVAGVELEDDKHTIVVPHNKFINDNGNGFPNNVLLESYHTFILAENFTEHVSLPEFSKGKVLDAVAWVVEKQFNGHAEPIPTVFIDCLLATNKKKHPRLVEKILSGLMNSVSMGCLKPEGLVTLADGTRRPISQIMEGDYVLNGQGGADRVKRVLVREVEDETIYEGDVWGVHDGFCLTGEHPLILSKGTKKQVQGTRKRKILVPHNCSGPSPYPDYYRVDSIKDCDQKGVDASRYYVEEVYPRDIWIPSETVTEDEAELLGMLAGNGVLKEGDSDRPPTIELHLNVGSWGGIAQRGRDLMDRTCGYHNHYDHDLTIESVYIRNHDRERYIFFKKFLSGRVAPEKKLAAEVLYWPLHLQKALIRGYFNTDGDVYDRTLQLKAESRSKDLIDQIYLILLRIGAVANKTEVTHQPTGFSLGKDPYKMYVVTVCSSQNEGWMCDKLPPSKTKGTLNGMSFFRGTGLTRPVRGLRESRYTGLIYNLEIEGDPSYLHNNLHVHNCDVLFTQCSRCGKVIEEGEDKVCTHIESQLGRYYEDSQGNRRRVAELCGVEGKKGSCVFKELSLVAKPAFMLARLHGFLDYGDESTGRPLKSIVPYGRYRESNKDI